MAQLGEPLPQVLEQRHRSMAVLNVCRVNVNGQQKAVGIGDDVPLAPVNALAGVQAAWPAGLGCWRTAYNGLVAVRPLPDRDWSQFIAANAWI